MKTPKMDDIWAKQGIMEKNMEITRREKHGLYGYNGKEHGNNYNGCERSVTALHFVAQVGSERSLEDARAGCHG